MAIKGHVDGMEGSYAAGWAVAEPDTGNCAITIHNEADEIIAKGRASRHRPDLASLGLGRTTFAFRIPVPPSAKRRVLHIKANGAELAGSPIITGAGQFDAECTVHKAMVTGWITERCPNFVLPAVTIINQHGTVVGRGSASQDAKDIDPLFTPARFSIELDDLCFGAGGMQLTIMANKVPVGKGICNLRLNGNLETITAESCTGWLVSPDAPGREFEIEIFRNGVHAATARCEHEREDVRTIYPECETPGFRATLPPAASAVETNTISLRFGGSRAELFDGPYLVANQAAAVAAAYRAVRLANMELPCIGAGERAAIQLALGAFLTKIRDENGFTATKQLGSGAALKSEWRHTIIIPVYRGFEVTHACIDSVLAHRNPKTDRLILINDCSPDAWMAKMLAFYATQPNVSLLTNETNLGFVQTVNRGLAHANGADVLLLNSDTIVHAGAFDELIRVAYAKPEIGSVTALSNNATIFSYPHAALRQEALIDITWPELAALALAENTGLFTDVPTGHGFCMFVKGEVTRRIGFLDEAFGRGYGEENDFCARAAALGYRNVAAAGVIVEHKESISFENEKASLLAQNLPRLNTLYPEYTPIIMDFERQDGLRRARWALDRARLNRAVASGKSFVLLVSNALEGGTAHAIADIERSVGYGAAAKLTLRCTDDGLLELAGEDPLMRASFTPEEAPELMTLLDAAAPGQILMHQLLGFPAGFINAFGTWASGRHSVFYAHDFYTFCPRVTMIDAVGRFCDVADAATCGRCVEMGGAHENSRLTELAPAEHRAIFAELLGGFRHVLAPSANAAGYLTRAFPGLSVETLPHPESAEGVAAQPRDGNFDEIIMLGAIGAHKGSGTLAEIARRARLSHPHLHFRVIGYTNIDKQLRAIGNVTITGKFTAFELPRLLAQSTGKLALFLPSWPETYSYTLSETVRHGLIPLLPDIGAPAERVRAAQYGVLFPFPADAATVLRVIDDLAAGRVATHAEGATPARFFPRPEVLQRAREVLALEPPAKRKTISRRGK